MRRTRRWNPLKQHAGRRGSARQWGGTACAKPLHRFQFRGKCLPRLNHTTTLLAHQTCTTSEDKTVWDGLGTGGRTEGLTLIGMTGQASYQWTLNMQNAKQNLRPTP